MWTVCMEVKMLEQNITFAWIEWYIFNFIPQKLFDTLLHTNLMDGH